MNTDNEKLLEQNDYLVQQPKGTNYNFLLQIGDRTEPKAFSWIGENFEDTLEDYSMGIIYYLQASKPKFRLEEYKNYTCTLVLNNHYYSATGLETFNNEVFKQQCKNITLEQFNNELSLKTFSNIILGE
jgi:hypothetical protein